MNLKQQTRIARERMPKKIPTLSRIKWGRVIAFVAALPLFTSWMFLISAPMMMAVSPTVWLKGKMNTFKGNGDLQYE